MRMVIYHGGCTDGFGAAYMAWKKFGDYDTLYVPVFNHMAEPPPVEGMEVYMLDFSYGGRAEVIKKMLKEAKSLKLIDHHRSAIDNLSWVPGAILNENFSGARLAQQYFLELSAQPTKDLVAYIQDRDLWRWELPHSKEVSAYINLFSHDFEQWNMLEAEIACNLQYVANFGKKLLAAEKKTVDGLLKAGAHYIMFGDYEVPAVNSATFRSELCDALKPFGPFAVCYSIAKDGHTRYSLRSANDGADVNAIAAKYGGGGHVRAAGLSSPKPLHTYLGELHYWGNDE